MSIFQKLFRGKAPKKGRGLNQRNAERAKNPSANFIDGLRNTRERVRIPIHPSSKEPLLSWERRELINMGRYLYANDGIVKGAIDDLARYALPLTPQAITSDNDWNTQAEALFQNWAEAADIKERIPFQDLQRLASVSIDRDGDVGVLFVESDNGYKVQLIEADRIVDHPDQEGDYSQGVRLDKIGRPMSFCIREDGGEGYRIVRSDLMQLLLEPERADQVRGVSSISHAVAHLRDKKEILSFEKAGVKNISSFAAVLESEFDDIDEDAFGLTEEQVTDAEGNTTEITVSQMQSGSVPVLRKGEKLQTIDHNRPSQTFQGFLEFLVREFAVGLGLPYEFIWDTHGLTGPSQRFVIAKAQRKFEERQRLIAPMVKRAWVMVIGDAIAKQLLPVGPKGWELCKVQPPAKMTIDVGREAREERADVSSGLMSLREHFGARGLDWQSELSQQAAELSSIIKMSKQIAKEQGIPVEVVLARLGATHESIVREQVKDNEELDQDTN